jgi:P-type conjugative transfer protein TrbJ
MSRKTRTFLAISMALLLGVSPHTERAEAQIGLPGLATEFTQLANKLQLLLAYTRQGQQLANQLQMYQNMAQNSKTLPSQSFSPLVADISALNTIAQTGQALAYSMANIDVQFRNTFKGYASWSPNQWYVNYQTWSNRSLDTTLGTMRAAGLQASQMSSEGALMDQLKVMAQSSDGHMMALQVSNQIAHEQVDQLMKLRQLVLADLQSKQAYQAMMIQQEATRQAAGQQFFTFNGKSGDGVSFIPGR